MRFSTSASLQSACLYVCLSARDRVSVYVCALVSECCRAGPCRSLWLAYMRGGREVILEPSTCRARLQVYRARVRQSLSLTSECLYTLEANPERATRSQGSWLLCNYNVMVEELDGCEGARSLSFLSLLSLSLSLSTTSRLSQGRAAVLRITFFVCFSFRAPFRSFFECANALGGRQTLWNFVVVYLYSRRPQQLIMCCLREKRDDLAPASKQ